MANKHEYRDRLLNYNPNPADDATSVSSIPSSPDCPLQFFDRHIADHLFLKRVVLLPSLVSDLSSVVDTYAEKLDSIPDDLYVFVPQRMEGNDAISLLDKRGMDVTLACATIALRVLVHPEEDLPDMLSFLQWSRFGLEDRNEYVAQDTSLRFADLIHNHNFGHLVPKCILDQDHSKLVALMNNVPILCTGMFFCQAAKPVLEEMGSLAKHKTFPWWLDSTYTGQKLNANPDATLPPDAPETHWKLPKRKTRPLVRQRTGLRSTSASSPVSLGTVTPIIEPVLAKENYKPQSKDFVQRAWANTVRSDATGILFDCGDFLRIGIRHRQSQTLFLSDMVDVYACKDPAFGKFWLGLHLALVYDAIQRLPFRTASAEKIDIPATFVASPQVIIEDAGIREDSHRHEMSAHKSRQVVVVASSNSEVDNIDPTHRSHSKKPSTPPLNLRKRPSADMNEGKSLVPIPPHKRRKSLEEECARLDKILSDTDEKLRYRDATLFYFRFGVYDSPAPAVLLAEGFHHAPQYEPDNYGTVVVGDHLGSGATGQVHRASIAFDPCDTNEYCPFIVKIATSMEKIERIKHEDSIYSTLRSDDIVEGLPRYLGYHEDTYNNISILMLSDVGVPLSRHPDKGSVLADHGPKLEAILQSLHDAKVLHRDIRSWNILADTYGRVTIVDLDRSSWDVAKPDQYEAEMARLRALISGEDVDGLPMIGEEV